MDYEKKYNEALKRAKDFKNGIVQFALEPGESIVHYIFPELRESEDERGRKRAIAILKQQRDYWSYDGPINKFPPATPRKDLVDAIDVALSYLEKQKEYHIPWYDYQKSKEAGYTIVPNEEYEQLIKQKEQKPAWSEEDEDRIRQIERIAQQAGCTQKLQEEIHDWLKSLRPQQKQEWSEEDERIVGRIQMILEFFDRNYPADMNIGSEVPKYISWLKSIRPSWKPSEEQMDSLRDTIVQTKGYSYSMYLPDLYEQLKKL